MAPNPPLRREFSIAQIIHGLSPWLLTRSTGHPCLSFRTGSARQHLDAIDRLAMARICPPKTGARRFFHAWCWAWPTVYAAGMSLPGVCTPDARRRQAILEAAARSAGVKSIGDLGPAAGVIFDQPTAPPRHTRRQPADERESPSRNTVARVLSKAGVAVKSFMVIAPSLAVIAKAERASTGPAA